MKKSIASFVVVVLIIGLFCYNGDQWTQPGLYPDPQRAG